MLSAVLGVALILSAWTWQAPTSDNTQTLESANQVEVTVAEDSLVMSTTSLDTGSVSFEVTNEGDEPHSFAIAGPAEERLEREVAAGETATLETNLELGTYTAYCPVQGHADQESTEFTVGQ